jgi:hypothetical protein
MKKLIIAAAALLALNGMQAQTHCDADKEKPNKKNTKANKQGNYGALITTDGAMDVKSLAVKMEGADNVDVKIKGEVVAVCQVKGCWMTADLGNGKTMRIRFKDYAFFMPKDANGSTFYAQGKASWETTSVAQLRHYAEDAGKSKEEIEKITEPKKELVFLAEGVILESAKK